MNCPRCNGPATEETLREFGGVCPKCLLKFAEEKDAPAFPSLEIVEMVGQGGMGVVYKAVQKSLGRTVALKVLSPQLSSDPEFVERFTREAKALAQLSHPNIVAIHDSGIHDKVPYLVMEFVEGKSLRQLLASRELTAPQALELVPQICDALYYAHSRGVVHRDIKPENILIDAAGRVKIADYGLAKIASLDQPRITKTNIAMGTPHYMAPEQIEKTSEVDHRADIYSLGVVIYEMLTGELPLGRFKPPSEKAVIDRRLDRVVLKSLEKEPDDRYQSANEVKEQLARPTEEGAVPPMMPQPGKVDLLGTAFYVLVGLLSAGSALLFALGRTSLGISCCFATLTFLMISGFRTAAVRQARQPVRPDPAGARLSRLAVASGIVCLGGLGFLLAAIVLMTLDQVIAANVVAAVSGLAFLAAIILSFTAMIRILGSRGALLGLWMPVTSLITSAIVLLGGVAMISVTASPAPAAPTTSAIHPTEPLGSLSLDDVWPEEKELPAGLRYESLTADAEEICRNSSMPVRDSSLIASAKMATLADFKIVLLGVEFKSPEEMNLWKIDPFTIHRGIERWRFRAQGDRTLLYLMPMDPAVQAKTELLWGRIRARQARNR